jgi:ketosteroid isomerase-like protein
MALYDVWASALDNKDLQAALACLADDYVFVRHQSGTSMGKEAMAGMLQAMMASEDVCFRQRRCVYENDAILVEHVFVDFADGSSEAVLSVSTLEGGKMKRTETGATLLSKS